MLFNFTVMSCTQVVRLLTRIAYYIIYFCIVYRVHANLVGTLSGHASWVLSVSFSPDGKRFVSGSADRTVRVWELENMQCQTVFKGHTDQVKFLITNAISCIKNY